MRPKGSPSADMSKNTFGRLILPVWDFDFVEYDVEVNPPANECLWAKQCWNCRRVNKRNVVDAIVVDLVRILRLCGEKTLRRPKKMETLRVAGRCSTVICRFGTKHPSRRRQCGVTGPPTHRWEYKYHGIVPWWYRGNVSTYCSAGSLPILSTQVSETCSGLRVTAPTRDATPRPEKRRVSSTE